MNAYPDAPRPSGDIPPPEPAEQAPPGSVDPSAPEAEAPPSADPPSPPRGGTGQSNPGATPLAWRYGLVRPRQGRYLGGVCAAIGQATNTDPVLWRVLLLVTSFLGVGILVYLAGWLLIPAEGDNASPLESLLGRGRSSSSPVLAVLIGLVALLVFGTMFDDGLRKPLLVLAVVAGGLILISRNQENRQAGMTTGQQQPPVPPPHSAPPRYSPPTPYTQTAPAHPAGPGPYGAAYQAPPAAGGPVPAGAAPPPAGYRPPFAPRGPYAEGPGAAFQPPLAYSPQPKRPAKPPRERSRLGAFTISLVLLALGTATALDLANVVDMNASGYFAAMLAMVGLGLLIGAWVGRSRMLIALGLVLACGLGIATAVEHVDSSDSGSRVWRPTTVSELQDEYRQNFGKSKLDLRQIDFSEETASVTVRVNLGKFEVLLPPEVDTTVSADVNAGNVDVFGTRWSGFNSASHEVTDRGTDGAGGGQLRLNLRVNAGEVEVYR